MVPEVGVDEERRWPADGGGHPLATAVGVHGDGLDHQVVLPVGASHEPEHRAVRPERGMLPRGLLADDHVRDAPVGSGPVHAHRVQRRRLEPEPRPLVERSSGGLAESVEQVRQRGVAPGVAGDVGVQPAPEGLLPDGRHELLDDRRPLLVGDGVEVADRFVGVLHRRGHGVGRAQLVLAVGGRAHVAVEGSARRP